MTALLSLLLPDGPEDAASRLHHAIRSLPDIDFAHDNGGTGTEIAIFHRALVFNVRIADAAVLPAKHKRIYCGEDDLACASHLQFRMADIIKGGERAPAVLRSLLRVAAALGKELNASAAYWSPAAILTGFDYFRDAVLEYDSGGALPVLALVNFKALGGGAIGTVGLAALGGQELHATASAVEPKDLMRTVARVAHDIAINGPIREPVTLAGLDEGEQVLLEPDAGRSIVRMQLMPG